MRVGLRVGLGVPTAEVSGSHDFRSEAISVVHVRVANCSNLYVKTPARLSGAIKKGPTCSRDIYPSLMLLRLKYNVFGQVFSASQLTCASVPEALKLRPLKLVPRWVLLGTNTESRKGPR